MNPTPAQVAIILHGLIAKLAEHALAMEVLTLEGRGPSDETWTSLDHDLLEARGRLVALSIPPGTAAPSSL